MTRGRPKKQVNTVSANRLGIILDELKEQYGISQTDFAGQINMAQQNVSKLRNGKVVLSKEHAESITSAFPDYRAEWLLGLDDFKTREDYQDHLEKDSRTALGQAISERRSLRLGFLHLARLNGYTVIEGLSALLNNTGSGIPAEDDRETINNSWYVRQNDKWARLSRDEMSRLQNEIADFVDFKLGRLLKERESRS